MTPRRLWATWMLAAVSLAATPTLAAGQLPLTELTLSTSGVAQFTHRGTVSGDATVSLTVHPDQIDDVLKSLLVLDPKGATASIRLPGQAPLEQSFRSFRFSPSDLTTMPDLLRALTGVEIRVSGKRELSGKLITVAAEGSTGPDSPIPYITAPVRHRVSLLTAAGIQQFVLEEAESIALGDNVDEEVQAALSAIRTHGARDRREITLDLRGTSERTVTLSYVADAPIWKAAYRLVLNPGNDTARLQGWAVFENAGIEPWQDVSVTLVSGNPVTYRQALYSPYYIMRPELPVQVHSQVQPRADMGEIMSLSPAPGHAGVDMHKRSPTQTPGRPMALERQDPIRPAQQLNMMAGGVAQQADEAVGQVRFAFSRKFSAPAGNSISAPITDSTIPAKAVWLYQPDTHARHPLMSVRIANDSDTTLPAGILTLFGGECAGQNCVAPFGGDTAFPAIPAGEQRIVNFALDRTTLIERRDEHDSATRKVAISDGIMRITRGMRHVTAYTVRAPESADRTVIIEHPKRTGWELVDLKPAETPTHYRIPVEVDAGDTRKMNVALERVTMERIALLNLDSDAATAQASAVGKLAPRVRDALLAIAEKRRAVARLEGERAQIAEQYQASLGDQERIRANLSAVPDGSDIQRQYLAKLTDRETEIDRLRDSGAELDRRVADARRELADFIQDLSF